MTSKDDDLPKDDAPSKTERGPVMPSVGDRMQALFVPAPHPALVSAERLFAECDHRFQRRSGPGGQHRNKTSSGVFLFHQPTGVTAEATERRSQADNRGEALMRLRMKMATEVRTVSILDLGDEGDFGDERVVNPIERDVRTRYRSRSLRFRDTNPDRPSVLALVINDLHAAGGQPSLVAKVWSTSTTAIVSLLKSHSPALGWINAVRFHHGRGPLK